MINLQKLVNKPCSEDGRMLHGKKCYQKERRIEERYTEFSLRRSVSMVEIESPLGKMSE